MWTALPMTHGSDNVTLLPYDRDFSCHKPITAQRVVHARTQNLHHEPNSRNHKILAQLNSIQLAFPNSQLNSKTADTHTKRQISKPTRPYRYSP